MTLIEQLLNDKKIISGFPGIGKSELFKIYGEARVSDSDSSKFPKDSFPANYVAHIKDLIVNSNKKYILVSSHKVVRDALVAEGIPFFLVYPNENCKDEYINRYIKRGSPEAFVSLLSNNFNNFVQECKTTNSPIATHIELSDGQYLSDVLSTIG
ncbi:g133 [Yersinia phage phiR1-37]|uniref:hypothetical protein n=1 Tax=Yersinia phage phiR1-37 TaxID=331278 RepID=UPI00022DBD31|nr:hypothetical protein phiR1-37_gp133 [Yersinia phage phiR1-37]CCE26157.1 g133 [Yersinia phage phiR1-37]